MKNKNTNYGCLWVFIAVAVFCIIAIASQNVKADGVDDPNFYKDLDKNPCAYDLGVKCEDEYIKPRHIEHYKKLEIPGCVNDVLENRIGRKQERCQDIKPVPKPVPKPLPLMRLGIAAVLASIQLSLIWIFRNLWIQQVMIFLALFVTALVFSWALTGCGSVGTITRFADGTISETHAITFGSTAAVTDFSDRITGTGRSISFGAGKTDVNVEALRQSNELLGTVVEGFTSGAIKGIK
jgi:hypothetical protein